MRVRRGGRPMCTIFEENSTPMVCEESTRPVELFSCCLMPYGKEVVHGTTGRGVHSFLTKRWSRHDLFDTALSAPGYWEMELERAVLSGTAGTEQYYLREVIIHAPQFLSPLAPSSVLNRVRTYLVPGGRGRRARRRTARCARTRHGAFTGLCAKLLLLRVLKMHVKRQVSTRKRGTKKYGVVARFGLGLRGHTFGLGLRYRVTTRARVGAEDHQETQGLANRGWESCHETRPRLTGCISRIMVSILHESIDTIVLSTLICALSRECMKLCWVKRGFGSPCELTYEKPALSRRQCRLESTKVYTNGKRTYKCTTGLVSSM